MMRDLFEIKFVPSGRGKAQCPPDPSYPNGKVVQGPEGVLACEVTLPYPAPECGVFIVHCKFCRLTVAVTAAGRPDDPVKIHLPCGLELEAEGHS